MIQTAVFTKDIWDGERGADITLKDAVLIKRILDYEV